MNLLRRFVVLGHRFGLEILLAVSILSLVGQLSWPGLVRWWYLPSPGTVGVDEFTSNSIAEKFVVYLPEGYRQKKSWPLIVFLHGSGERGNDPNVIRNCPPLRLKLGAVVATPQCLPSYSWNPEDVAQFTKHVTNNYRVDRTRIYLVGYSMGGYGTWFTATAHPELFAAIAPISGGGDPGRASALVDMPIWAFHGRRRERARLGSQQSVMIGGIRYTLVEALQRFPNEPTSHRPPVAPLDDLSAINQALDEVGLWPRARITSIALFKSSPA